MSASKISYTQKKSQENFSENSKINQNCIMSRLDWFKYAEEAFNFAKHNYSLLKINANQLISSLEKLSYKLPLLSPPQYYSINSLYPYSYNEVIQKILEFSQDFDCDELIDSLIEIKKKPEYKIKIDRTSPEKIELKTHINSQNDANSGQSSNCISISHAESFVMPKFSAQILYINLSDNRISQAKWEIPQSLVLLNLSNNLLTEFSNKNPLINLQYLNLSGNRIASIENFAEFRELIEVYIEKNFIENIGSLCNTENLKLIDAAHNLIEKYEDIAPLAASAKLQTLSLKGNKITKNLNYQEFAKNFFSKISTIDPPNIFSLSKCPIPNLLFSSLYSQILPPADISKRSSSLSIPTQKISLENSHKIDLSQISCLEILNSSKTSTPKTCTRSTTPMFIDKSKISRSTNASPRSAKINIQPRTPERSSKKVLQSKLVSSGRISQSDESFKNFSMASKVSVINSESITSSLKIGYGNPISAMMIKPALSTKIKPKT
ncbi:unnamed protein product [Blepharisma stoltei]|uniref:Uncharacterized protein n=1 Tax=Blepharisma stoltei TaxID=1481888 RepID=A0AAU9IKA4_9CILI|nr:unnamed protein product [Blepharisma stoltei]